MLNETFSVIFKHRVLCKVEREETTYIIRVPAKKEYVSDKVFILLMYFYTSTLGTWECCIIGGRFLSLRIVLVQLELSFYIIQSNSTTSGSGAIARLLSMKS